MTLIVGYKENGRVFMGGDSAMSSGYRLDVMQDKKVFKRDGFIIGFAGNAKVAHTIQYNVNFPPIETTELIKYITTDFVDSIRIKLMEKNEGVIEDGIQKLDGRLLVGIKGRLFYMASNFACIEPIKPFMSIGIADDYAMGAMEILHKLKIPSEEKVMKALQVCKGFEGVAPPFYVETLDVQQL